jgi:hypothetical protein
VSHECPEGSHKFFGPGGDLAKFSHGTVGLPISASQVAKITDVNHWCLDKRRLFIDS